MRILVVGGGGREHALAWKLAQNPTVDKMFAVPGNAGISDVAQCEPIPPTDIRAVADFAEAQGVDLTVVGPEAPLVAGIADEFASRGLPVFGPTAAAARIEGSKSWAKHIMERAGIRTARGRSLSDPGEALAFVREIGAPCVVKADGLAAGKGVTICEDLAEAQDAVHACLERGSFGDAGRTVLIEEYLEGEELSVFCLTDGRAVLPLVSSQDHKRLLDGDRGPNTGGMGAYSPVLHLSAAGDRALDEIFAPAVRALDAEGARYQGVLYGGLMVTADGPVVLEFNCRFGDPEAQAIVPRLESDLAELLLACVEGNLAPYRPRWTEQSCVCVVAASGAYPEPAESGKVISGLEEAATVEGVQVFHAATAIRGGKVVTAGGRVLGVSALAPDLAGARGRAYEAVERLSFEGMQYRADIGARGLLESGRRGAAPQERGDR